MPPYGLWRCAGALIMQMNLLDHLGVVLTNRIESESLSLEHQKPAIDDARDAGHSFVVRHDFDDVDELAVVARSWDLDLRQLDRGAFTGRVVQVGSPNFQLGRTRLQGVIHQHGSAPPDLLTFAFSATDRIRHAWRGNEVRADDLMIHGSSGELESLSRADFDIFVASVSPASLLEAAVDAGIDLDERLLETLELAACPPLAIEALRRSCGSALAVLLRDPAMLQRSKLATVMEGEISEGLVRCLFPGLGIDPENRRVQPRRFIDDAVQIARTRAHEIHTVQALSLASGASRRTLRRGFRERFGITAKEFIQTQRLIGVRRLLKATGSDALISDIANEWGFWHMGQFAADYRRRFGELPSETVRNGRSG